MHVLVVTSGRVPFPGLQGSALVTWSLVIALQELGHKVDVCVLKRENIHDRDELLLPLRAAGIECHLLAASDEDTTRLQTDDRSPSGRLRAKVGNSYKEVAFSHQLKTLVESVKPDVVFLYTAKAVAASIAEGDYPLRIASVVDLDHVARRERFFFDLKYRRGKLPDYKSLWKLIRNRDLAKQHTLLLGACDRVVSHAAHHATWLQEHGVPQTVYLPLPVVDNKLPKSPRHTNSSEDHRRKFKIITVGSTRGIATLTGIPLLVGEILPALDEKLGADNYELQMIGAMVRLPPQFERRLKERGNVRIRGYVENIADEFRDADVMLVPTPTELGFRTRIAEAFSYGCCVVAHSANQKGMPQLKHRQNILLADTGSEVAEACAQVLADPQLKMSLGSEARRTFEIHYEARAVCRQMVSLMAEALAEVRTPKL